MKTGIELIAEERSEHPSKHGRTILDDVQNNDRGQLALAAGFLINSCDLSEEPEDLIREYCPPGWDEEIWLKMTRKTYKKRIIIAGSLLAGELDRLNWLESVDEEDRLDIENEAPSK